MSHNSTIESIQLGKAGELLINWNILRTQLERNRKRCTIGLNGKVVSHLVVQLIFGRQPHQSPIVGKARKNGLVGLLATPRSYELAHILNGRFATELTFGISGNTVRIGLDIPTNAPLVAPWIDTLKQRNILATLYSFYVHNRLI